MIRSCIIGNIIQSVQDAAKNWDKRMIKKYRLLDDGEIIYESDEVLDQNCELWNTPIMFATGEPYNKGKMPPYRRQILGEYDEAYDYVCKRFKLPRSNHVCELDRGLNANGHTMVEVFVAGQKKERLKHDPKESLESFASNDEYKAMAFEGNEDRITRIVKAWDKNRGYDV